MVKDAGPDNFTNTSPDADNQLRQRAEDLLRRQPEELRETPLADVKQLVHDLQVHQIELEMQNDELLRTRRVLEVVQLRFRDLYDFAPVGYLTLNIKGFILQANLTLVTMLGVDRYSLVNQPFSHFILPEDQDNYYFHRRNLFETRKAQVCELRLVSKDGSLFWARLDAIVTQDSEDQTLCRVTITDISEQVRIHDQLRKSEEKFRNFADKALVGVYQTTLEGKFLYANKTLTGMLGFAAPAEILTENIADRYRQPGDSLALLAQLQKDGHVDSYELEILTTTGMAKHVIVSAYLEGDSIQGMMVDLTEFRQAQSALQENEAMLRSILRAAPTGIGVVSNRVFIDVNDRFCQMLGYLREELIGQNARLIYPTEEEYTNVGSAKYSQIREEGIGTVETRMKRKDGEIIEVMLSSTPLDPDDLAGGVVFTALDITERKRANKILLTYSEKLEEMVEARTQELQDLHEQLIRQEKLAALGQLAGGVGHELRTPLNAIKIATYYLNMVLPEQNRDPEIQKTLKVLERETATAERIVTSLLDYARTRLPNWNLVNFNNLLLDVVSRTPLPDAPRIELELQLDHELPDITADPDKLSQVFNNLVLNAVQAMPEGGQLIVRTEKEIPEWVKVSITDTGTGIPEKNLGRLFVPLFTTKTQGIGLGLTVVKNLVEEHGGTIGVISQVGTGSTFTVRLPVDASRSTNNT